MKRLIILLLGISILSSCSNNKKESSSTSDISGRISISGAFALYPLTIVWAEEFKKIHPDVKIDISAGGAGKGIADVLSGMVDIAMLSRDIKQEEISQGAYPLVVAKDAVVPVINASNPLINDILKRGITIDELKSVYLSNKKYNWGQLSGTNNNAGVNVFTRSDACGAASVWGQFFGKEQEDLQGIGVFGDPGMADAVLKDKYAIGYNNVIYAYDIKSRKKISRLEIIPLDLNSNGKIDTDEDFYSSLDSLFSAIKKGKYPSPPARDLYFVTKGKPENKLIIEFVKFILDKGQAMVDKAGYIPVNDSMAKLELSKL